MTLTQAQVERLARARVDPDGTLVREAAGALLRRRAGRGLRCRRRRSPGLRLRVVDRGRPGIGAKTSTLAAFAGAATESLAPSGGAAAPYGDGGFNSPP